MDIKSQSSKKTLLLLAASACILFVMTACGIATALGSGSPLWLTRPETDANAPSSASIPPAATITNLRGWVEVKSPAGLWATAQPDQQVNVGQHIRTGSLSSAVLSFRDGSQATLQANAELVIDSLEAPERGGPRKIILTQLSGEISHEVAHSTSTNSKYLVNTPMGTVEAKGTIFTVAIISKGSAYYSVTEGMIAVTGMQETVLVNAGEVSSSSPGQPPLEPGLNVSGQGIVTQIGDFWIIAGQEFTVTEATLITGSPRIGDWVKVMGRIREDGTNVADWIALLHSSPANRFSITGRVETRSETQWTVQGQEIVIDPLAAISEGISVGTMVRVEGIVLEGGVLQAEKIILINEERLRFDFIGVVQKISSEHWSISGTTILIDKASIIEENLTAGDIVHVEGHILENGDWLAESISAAPDEESGFHISGTLESLNPWKVAGLSFETREWTVIENNLEAGDQVRVVGRIDEQGLWIADLIERLEDETTRLVLIGTVISMDPWLVSGIPLSITPETVIGGEIKVGMLVKVEIMFADDGTWRVVRIDPLGVVGWFPGCLDIVAKVVSINGSEIQLENWPVLTLGEGVEIEGEITPNSVVRFRICFGDDMVIRIVYIIVIDPGDVDPPAPVENGNKVTVCHKPDKKGGHTLSIGSPALQAHLGHGDYLGPCH